MLTMLTDSMTAVRLVLSRVGVALGLRPAMPAMVAAPASAAISAPVPFVMTTNPLASTTRWCGGAEFMYGNHDAACTKRIHPGRLGGST